MIWDQLTSEQLGAVNKSTPVLLPLAATEQHGAHLPLATDRLIAEHFAHQVHLAIPEKVLILPAVGVGCSHHHLDFAGTLTVSHATFLSQVQDIVDSVIHHGFFKIIFLNSHGGNMGIGQVIVEKEGFKNSNSHLVMVTWWRIVTEGLSKISETGFGGVGHACEFETSLMMLIDPTLVHTDKISKGLNQPGFDWARGDMLRAPQAVHYRTMKQLTPNGIFGDPTAASAEKGQRISRLVVHRLQEIVEDIYNAE